ncbi:MAG: NAD(P)/FAD-dependent oxidoreductase [Nitrososphaeraceae archaeon]|jgi:thioredoxin reductase (NADPH)
MPPSLEEWDVIIIGGASAGLSAALYASRQGLNTLLITKDIGGQALLTNDIENYPAFDHIGGYELMTKFEEQARSFGTKFAYEEVTSIVGYSEEEENNKPTKNYFKIKTSGNNEYLASAVILAFGKTPRDLNVPGEQQFKGKGVSYCAVCDGPLFKQKRVGVVGIGDPSLDAALFLKGIASKVYIIHQTSTPIGTEETIRLLQNEKNVSFMPNSIVKGINGTSKVESLTIANTKTKSTSSLSSSSESKLDVDGIFVEMGYIAKTDFIKELVQLNSSNEIIVDKYCATSTPGIFAAGDVTDVPYKQAVISAGQGSIAALSAYNYIQKLKGGKSQPIKADWKSSKSSK